MSNLIKIDELVLGEHGSVSSNDDCYYLMEYTAHRGYSYSTGNDWIQNLKKPVSRKNNPEWRYKEMAIRKFAAELTAALPAIIDFDKTTLIPIPPSKTRSNPLFDDRLQQILQIACPDEADVRELILCRADLVAAHECTGPRPSVQELLANYELNPDVSPIIAERVVLFDDVITGGNHYVACKTFIENRYPGTKIIGVFIARRAVYRNSDLEDFYDL
jgi:hypothetical protein